MGVGGRAITGEEIEEGEAVGDRGGTRGIAATAQRGEQIAVSLARPGIAVAVEELGVGGPGGHAVGAGLGGAGERGPRAHGVSRRLHPLNRIETLFPEDRGYSGR